eukprot:11683571-Alexandrium_andersonii.AAC.1
MSRSRKLRPAILESAGYCGAGDPNMYILTSPDSSPKQPCSPGLFSSRHGKCGYSRLYPRSLGARCFE